MSLLYIKIFLKTLLALLFFIMHHVRSVFILRMQSFLNIVVALN